MKTSPQRLLAPLVLTALMLANMPTIASAQPVSAREARGIVSVDFPGGTIVEYAQSLRKDANKGNIIVNLDVSTRTLPAIELTDASLATSIEILPTIDPGLQVIQEGNVFIIKAAEDQRLLQAKALSVSEILKTRSKEDLLTAIELGIEMVGGSENSLRLQLHEETGLLFIKGEHQQIDIVTNILDELAPRTSNQSARDAALLNSARRLQQQEQQLQELMLDSQGDQQRQIQQQLMLQQMMKQLQQQNSGRRGGGGTRNQGGGGRSSGGGRGGQNSPSASGRSGIGQENTPAANRSGGEARSQESKEQNRGGK